MFSGSSQLKNEVEVRTSELRSVQSQHSQLQASLEQLTTLNQQLQSQKAELEAQVRHLRMEVEEAQQAIDGYKQECAQTLQDYTECAHDLQVVREERDRQKKQADIGLRELTKRADRIKLLERQRDDIQERYTHMEMQVSDVTAALFQAPLISGCSCSCPLIGGLTSSAYVWSMAPARMSSSATTF